MKSITFDGRIGANGAEIRQTRGGKPYVRFSVANNSFVNNQEKTEWFDVTSYDPYVIENRVKYLTKGTYVIINGSLNTDVNVKDNKVWVNQYVTASTIDTPYFGKKGDDEQSPQAIQTNVEPEVSTFTPQVNEEHTQSKKQTDKVPNVQLPQEDNGGDEDDELPF